MSDVFISYAREDAERARSLKQALDAEGLHTFWDEALPPGERFRKTLEREIDAAACVVVLWTASSVASDFVRSEAQRALDQEKIVPVMLDEVPLPLGLTEINYLRMIGWPEDPMVDRMSELLRSIRARIATGCDVPDNTVAVTPATTTLLIDNWLLEDVGLLLRDGVDDSFRTSIKLERGAHSLVPVPYAVIQLEALFSLLTELVLRDRLVVDAQYSRACAALHDTDTLVNMGLLDLRKFDAGHSDLREIRAQMVQEICVTDSLRRAQTENERTYAKHRVSRHEVESMIVWGGAGYLARAELAELTYSGHPLRRAFLNQTIFRPPRREDALAVVESWLRQERVKLFRRASLVGEDRAAVFVLPPIAIEVIESTDDADRLIATALSMRSFYAPVREWLSLYQAAIEDGDPRRLLIAKSELLEVTARVERTLKSQREDSTHLRFHRGARGARGSGGKMGFRALMGDLILRPGGQAAVDKLLEMLNAPRTGTWSHIRTQISSRFSIKET